MNISVPTLLLAAFCLTTGCRSTQSQASRATPVPLKSVPPELVEPGLYDRDESWAAHVGQAARGLDTWDLVILGLQVPSVSLEADGSAVVYFGWSPDSEIQPRYDGTWQREDAGVTISAANAYAHPVQARMWRSSGRTWFLVTNSLGAGPVPMQPMTEARRKGTTASKLVPQ